MPRQRPSHSSTPPRVRSLMVNKPLQDSVPEAWLMNAGDTEKTYVVQGGKIHAIITGPAASQIRAVSTRKS